MAADLRSRDPFDDVDWERLVRMRTNPPQQGPPAPPYTIESMPVPGQEPYSATKWLLETLMDKLMGRASDKIKLAPETEARSRAAEDFSR